MHKQIVLIVIFLWLSFFPKCYGQEPNYEITMTWNKWYLVGGLYYEYKSQDTYPVYLEATGSDYYGEDGTTLYLEGWITDSGIQRRMYMHMTYEMGKKDRGFWVATGSLESRNFYMVGKISGKLSFLKGAGVVYYEDPLSAGAITKATVKQLP